MLFVSSFIGVNPSIIGDRRANEVEIVFPTDSNEGFHATMTTFKNDLCIAPIPNAAMMTTGSLIFPAKESDPIKYKIFTLRQITGEFNEPLDVGLANVSLPTFCIAGTIHSKTTTNRISINYQTWTAQGLIASYVEINMVSNISPKRLPLLKIGSHVQVWGIIFNEKHLQGLDFSLLPVVGDINSASPEPTKNWFKKRDMPTDQDTILASPSKTLRKTT